METEFYEGEIKGVRVDDLPVLGIVSLILFEFFYSFFHELEVVLFGVWLNWRRELRGGRFLDVGEMLSIIKILF